MRQAVENPYRKGPEPKLTANGSCCGTPKDKGGVSMRVIIIVALLFISLITFLVHEKHVEESRHALIKEVPSKLRGLTNSRVGDKVMKPIKLNIEELQEEEASKIEDRQTKHFETEMSKKKNKKEEDTTVMQPTNIVAKPMDYQSVASTKFVEEHEAKKRIATLKTTSAPMLVQLNENNVTYVKTAPFTQPSKVNDLSLLSLNRTKEKINLKTAEISKAILQAEMDADKNKTLAPENENSEKVQLRMGTAVSRNEIQNSVLSLRIEKSKSADNKTESQESKIFKLSNEPAAASNIPILTKLSQTEEASISSLALTKEPVIPLSPPKIDSSSQQNKCDGDPFNNVPVDTFVPPLKAPLEDKYKFIDAQKAMLAGIKKMTIGGPKLREHIEKEVRTLQLLRHKLFCALA